MAFDAPNGPANEFATGVDAEPVEARFKLRARSVGLSESLDEVVLELSVSGPRDGRNTYQAVVQQAGVFDLSELEGVDRQRMLDVGCPHLLFQAARQRVEEMLRGAGFPALTWPLIDFDAVSANQQADAPASASLQELQRFWQALTHLQTASQTARRPANFQPIHAQALVVAQLSRDALPAADHVLAQTPKQPETLEILGTVYAMNNFQQRAVDVHRLMVALAPEVARAHYKLATSLMYTGDLEGARRESESCLQRQPTFWEAYTVLSTVLAPDREPSVQRKHVARLQSLLDRYGSESHACERLNMALAREYENLGEYARAFTHWTDGNAAGRARKQYDSGRDEALFDALAQQTSVAKSASAGFDTDEPIFVFGMPRSGTTLVERILSSHPEVTSAGELKQFGMLLKYMSGSPTADLLDVDTVARCRHLDWRALGQRYLASTRPLSGQTSRFIDKFPHHFMHAAYIIQALPRARIICVRRNPMDTCLGNFRQVFSELSPFHRYAFDLLDTGCYYVLFDRLMAHWHASFPGRILDVSYEALVQDQESGTRAMLDFCGLDWDPACLAFEKNRAPATTASAAQVRSPMYRDAMQRWKHYAEQLAPLRNLLIQAGVAVPLP